jgi:hypothetical protein
VTRRTTPALVLALTTLAGAVIAFASSGIAPAATASVPPANAPGSVGGGGPPSKVKLCDAGQHITVDGPWGDYVVKNNDYYPGPAPECITHYKEGPDFNVTYSRAKAFGSESDAYPNIFLGCSWGTCSSDTPLPALLTNLHHPWVSWNTQLQHTGKWDANFDIWLSKLPRKRGQITGAEVMIWEATRGFGATTTSYRIDGIRFHLVHWTTRSLVHPKTTWPLIIFRAVRPRQSFHRLALMPFFRILEHLHLIKSAWYLNSLHAGFEIWHGGTDMRTTWFRVHTGLR